MDLPIEDRINIFKGELPSRSAIEIVRRHVIFGDCFILATGDYFDLKENIARQFGVHPNEVLVVGSGKLGFSIAPRKRYRAFNDESDIDVTIISGPLFDRVWKDAYRYWHDGGYWETQSVFRHSLFTGWIRPDRLPPEARFSFSKEWWEYFRTLTAGARFGPYRIRGALYRSWEFLESYQSVAVKSCQEALAGEP